MKRPSNPGWLPLLILPLIGLVAAGMIIAGSSGPDSSNSPDRSTEYPSPAPATYIPTTPRPTAPTTYLAPVEQDVVGSPAPDFILDTLDGGTVHMHDLAGQIVFLNFWATWCPPCQEEMPALQVLHDTRGAEGVRVIAITDPTAGQTEADVRQFMDDHDLTLTVALSSDVALYQRFDVLQLPTTLIVDRAGFVRFRHVGAVTPDDIAVYLDQLE